MHTLIVRVRLVLCGIRRWPRIRHVGAVDLILQQHVGFVRSTRATHLDIVFSVRWPNRQCLSGADDFNDVRMGVVRGLVVTQWLISGVWQDRG